MSHFAKVNLRSCLFKANLQLVKCVLLTGCLNFSLQTLLETDWSTNQGMEARKLNILVHCPLVHQGTPEIKVEWGNGAVPVILAGAEGASPSAEMPKLDFLRVVSQCDGRASRKDCNLPTWGVQSPSCLKGTHCRSSVFLFVGAISCALKNCSHSWITAGTTGHQRPLCSKFCTCN